MRLTVSASLSLVGLLAATVLQTAAGTATDVTALPIWSPVIPQLRERVHIPLMLPSILPGDAQPERPGRPPDGDAFVQDVTARSYSIALGAPGCRGAHACTDADVSGVRGAAMPKGKRIILARGVAGIYTAATCGANCGDATVTWQMKGAVYAVGEKAGRLEELLPAANSAIKNGLIRL